MAKAIEIRPDGDLYIPIFESLEDEIQKRRSKTDTKSRISMIASRGLSWARGEAWCIQCHLRKSWVPNRLLKSASNTHDLCVVESSVLL